MMRIPRWRVKDDLGPKGTPASMGVTKSACGLTLRPQPRPDAPLVGLLAGLGSLSFP